MITEHSPGVTYIHFFISVLFFFIILNIILLQVKDYEIKDIAKKLKLTKNAVYKRIRVFRKNLPKNPTMLIMNNVITGGTEVSPVSLIGRILGYLGCIASLFYIF